MNMLNRALRLGLFVVPAVFITIPLSRAQWVTEEYHLNILHLIDGKATLEFLAIEGRTYIIEASHDLTTWKQVPFRIPFVDAPGVMRAAYLAPVVRHLEAEVLSDPARPVAYRLGVQ